GPPRDLKDRRVFLRIAVVACVAWVGLGADGLSSSAYGPEEAFRTLGEHTYLALVLALLMMATVFVISACYSRIIERFPQGGGGYVVATALLGRHAGVVSGAALLVDYVLTITVSIAAAGDALFSFVPPTWHEFKLPTEALLIVGLSTINIRGVKESILTLMPVFLLFLGTHIVLIGGGVTAHVSALPAVARDVSEGFRTGLATLGVGGLAMLFVHAYSLGGGTYTGIEAVSNGLPIMREPRVQTAKRTMMYMATSLALTAAGLVVCYLLWRVQFMPGKTLNAVLAERIAAELHLGSAFVILTLVSEGALLVVAAQAGFIDGPRVLANMALDGWVPRRFAALSERLTTQNGIVLMGGAALLALLYTRGDVRTIVVMYSINVFATFSLSMLGMALSLWRRRRSALPWKGRLSLFTVGFTFCITILAITVFQKFREGGWITLLVTSTLIALCILIRRHYRTINAKMTALYAQLADIPPVAEQPPGPPDPSKPTAAILVGGYSGLGIHTTLALFRAFPDYFKNLIFLSVGVIDSSALKGEDAVEQVRRLTEEVLQKYVTLAHRQAVPAAYRLAIGTDVVSELEDLCLKVAKEFPQVTFFAGQLIFQRERWYQRILHNETAFAVQKRLQWAAKTMVILPARVR
ncbi:MAG: APC family permease, partial [Planctomycetes bacterium]|nr:APC family permease [Planctomycetota bacterium]